MDTERWQQIEHIFQSALDCDPAKRAALLDSSCAGDAALRAEVESLLASYQQAGFTQAAVEEAAQVLESRSAQAFAGKRLGPYRILREIGHGGMGTVYLAARDDQAFQKQVAIKIIRRGLDTDEITSRFRGERQILATLDHPNITRLLDGGATDDGMPYFVMEYIEGAPVDRYCDEHKLNIADRLRLFQQVCAAVAYAHQNLVIHRDIKAGNVLVTKDGVPHLLDFGIAKLLAPGAAGEATLTGLRPLTPECASPEQILGAPITTASDVYSLGVLLFRLLTGVPPYGKRASTTELEHAICQEEPKRPSLAAASLDHNLQASLATTREGTPERLRRRLAGDLDNIVLKAMRKEPQRRYASALQLSEDIDRHLKNIPVVARPDTTGYRIAKFVRRNRVAVAAAALIVVSLTGGLATTLWEAHIARQQRDRARIQQAKAERINSFLQDILSYTSPEYASNNPTKNKDAKLSEVVEQAAKRAEIELADQPEVLAAVEYNIGGVYGGQGRFEQAEPLLRAAREKMIKIYGLQSHEVAEVSGALANMLLAQGKYSDADAMFRQNIEIERALEKRGQLSGSQMAYALGAYGAMLDQRSDPAAESYLREAIKYADRAFTGKERVAVAIMYNNLSNTLGHRGDAEASERYLRAALEEYRKLPEGQYEESTVSMINLGVLLASKGQYQEAEKLTLQALEVRRKILGDDHLSTAMGVFRLSDVYYRWGRYSDAEKTAQESIAICQRALRNPDDNILFANPLTELGLIFDKTSRYREAEMVLRHALQIRTRLLPKGNILIARTEAALGECLTLQKRYAQAEPLLLESYATIQAATRPGATPRADAAQRLATLYQSWGKPQQAAQYAPVTQASVK
jgi:serine/threonine protein kinase